MKDSGIKDSLIRIGIFLGILFIAGGFPAVLQGVDAIRQVFVELFPFLVSGIEIALEEYLQSAYFIVAVITFVLSTLGIVITVKEKHYLFVIIDSILDIASAVSVISNLAVCS
ncbi:MAG: hypothetical protein E7338_05650 [Clostridiales bacterium]|nr:hypothetical protein [Clostridiales bacterium]